MTFMGDGGTSSNDFHSGLNFAGGLQGAGGVRLREQPLGDLGAGVEGQTGSETIAQSRREAYGMPGVRVDGNDVLAVYRVCKEAVDRARKRRRARRSWRPSPIRMSLVTARPTTPSKLPRPGRPWPRRGPRSATPSSGFKQLPEEQRSIWTEALETEEVRTESKKASIDAAVKLALSSARPLPSPESMFDDVYMNAHPAAEAPSARSC